MTSDCTKKASGADDPRYVRISDREIANALMASRCIFCRRTKAVGRPFCHDDVLALPLWMRLRLAAPLRDASFAPTFCAALQHLRDVGSTRKFRVAESRTGQRIRWPYCTIDELEAAGYKRVGWSYKGYDYCQVPSCGQHVIWLRTPAGKRMAVNAGDVRPHFLSCKDPDYFRKRAEDKQAERKRRRASLKSLRKAESNG
jgi:hypothetical protein